MLEINKTYEGHALSVLKTFPEKIFNTCVTSPPYYGLRAYGTDPVIWDGDENCQHEFTEEIKKGITGGPCILEGAGKAMTEARYTPDTKHGFCIKCGAWKGELGSEPSPELFIKHLVDIFREVKRTLRDDGTIWVNMGDSYFGGGGASGHTSETKNLGRITESYGAVKTANRKSDYLKPKDLIGVPWMLAFALRADGWYLRQDIIWHKPNPMPESVTDRCTKSHEYIFLMSKSHKYYFDYESIQEDTVSFDTSIRDRDESKLNNTPGRTRMGGLVVNDYEKRNKRDVWTVTTKPYKEAHFATFPQELIIDCIKAGSPEGGLVLDPFGGANTTGVVSRKLNRNHIAIELNPKYIKIGDKRLYNEIGLYLEVV